MRRFSSYGTVNERSDYYVPRTALIDRALHELVGDENRDGGYITVWAPRQRGKTTLMHGVLRQLRQREDFHVVSESMEHLNGEGVLAAATAIADAIASQIGLEKPNVASLRDFESIFLRDHLSKPLVLVLDEFDSLADEVVAALARSFRRIHLRRAEQAHRPAAERHFLLHGVALVGVRSVLGVENREGSPFNVQRSLHIPNLTASEVQSMFDWYQRESGQAVEPAVVDKLYQETQGHPGLVSWLGELLTETHNPHREAVVAGSRGEPTLGVADFEHMYAAALHSLPNATIMNLIAKVREAPQRDFVLELFRTDQKVAFHFDEPHIAYLYTNGVIDEEPAANDRFVKFASPFVQKRLFNYFSHTDFAETGRTHAPFEDVSDAVTDTMLNVRGLLRRYERHLRENRDWLLQDAPRRADLRVREAVYHFTLYRFLCDFLDAWQGRVLPEFPTGNGRVDLLIRRAGQTYALEVKSYRSPGGYRDALRQAAKYAGELELSEIALAFFVEAIDDARRTQYEVVYLDDETGVRVIPTFVATG